MVHIDVTDLPSPPRVDDKRVYQYLLTLSQTLQSFVNQTTLLCDGFLLPTYATDMDQRVVSGTTSLVVTFSTPLPLATSYSVLITPHWNTTTWLSNVTSQSFFVNFGTAPVVTKTVDLVAYLIVPIPVNS